MLRDLEQMEGFGPRLCRPEVGCYISQSSIVDRTNVQANYPPTARNDDQDPQIISPSTAQRSVGADAVVDQRANPKNSQIPIANKQVQANKMRP